LFAFMSFFHDDGTNIFDVENYLAYYRTCTGTCTCTPMTKDFVCMIRYDAAGENSSAHDMLFHVRRLSR
jgi:hypothetical protein